MTCMRLVTGCVGIGAVYPPSPMGAALAVADQSRTSGTRLRDFTKMSSRAPCITYREAGEVEGDPAFRTNSPG